ncbi:kelch-like protein 25 [Amphiura filiformis]|uniref:kelch-like protein 25 n=1 Tax=Amphiura filiformis TaxID=82378 RepID=UPI003B21762C
MESSSEQGSASAEDRWVESESHSEQGSASPEDRWVYLEELVRGLNNLREQNQLCDVIISVGGKSFHAHKTVLAATGDYFLAMFTSGFRESSDKKIKIDGSAAAFEILLNFAYTGEVANSQVSACSYEVLEMACYMQFTRFAQICSSAIEEILEKNTCKLPVSDVCKVMLLAEKHTYLQQLHEASLKYLEDHVEGLKSLEVFLENTSMTLLEAFLSRENLANEDDEKQVLELVINWLKHDWENRKKHSHQLLQKVRLGLVASEDIKELVTPEILDIPECSDLVNQVLQMQGSKKPRDVLAIENPEIAATRSTIMAPVISYEGNFHYYAKEYKNWVSLEKFAPMPSKSAKYSMVVVDGVLYAVRGGRNNDGKEFYSYQAGDNKWLQLPSMSQCQYYTSLMSLGGYIYAIGMNQKISREQRSIRYIGPGIMMERFDINEKKWEVMKPPPDNFHHDPRKYSQGISSVVFEGKIFVSSARRMRGIGTYEELMVYDAETDNWQVNEVAQTGLEEEEQNDVVLSTLFVYKDQLYRILGQSNLMSDMYVSLVTLKSEEDGSMTVTVGDQLSQENLQSKETTAFCIGDKDFSIEDEGDLGVVCIQAADQVQDIEPSNLLFAMFPIYYPGSRKEWTSNPVWFKFDRKKLSSRHPKHTRVEFWQEGSLSSV